MSMLGEDRKMSSLIVHVQIGKYIKQIIIVKFLIWSRIWSRLTANLEHAVDIHAPICDHVLSTMG